jgi:hypothetical protein
MLSASGRLRSGVPSCSQERHTLPSATTPPRPRRCSPVARVRRRLSSHQPETRGTARGARNLEPVCISICGHAQRSISKFLVNNNVYCRLGGHSRTAGPAFREAVSPRWPSSAVVPSPSPPLEVRRDNRPTPASSRHAQANTLHCGCRPGAQRSPPGARAAARVPAGQQARGEDGSPCSSRSPFRPELPNSLQEINVASYRPRSGGVVAH